jgi:hypothetical protein
MRIIVRVVNAESTLMQWLSPCSHDIRQRETVQSERRTERQYETHARWQKLRPPQWLSSSRMTARSLVQMPLWPRQSAFWHAASQ